MKLTFCGAAQTVTGSMHLLQLESGHNILMDCGLFQGRREEANHINQTFLFTPSEIDVVLLSHAHIDHAGLLPKLWKEGFRGRVYATHATYDLCAIMLMDSAYIQESDAAFLNKRNKNRRGPQGPEIVPLYTQADTEELLKKFISVGYDTPFSPLPGVSVEYRDAGHILGSASMVVKVQEGGREKRLGFTGDIGRPGRPIIKDPKAMEDCDWIITESTYGGQTHAPTTETKEALAEIIRNTASRGGKILIPAFAVGRTQELVYALDQLWNEGELPRIPVYVDSPLAVSATAVFQSHPECYDEETRQYLREDENPFGFEKLRYVRSVDQSKGLNTQRGSMVVISASGMCEAGRILHHLRNNISNPKTTVLMVGFCAEHTLGRRLINKEPVVRIFGEDYIRKAEVVTLSSLSAHADEPELLAFLGNLDRDRLQKTFLVHGEVERQKLLQASLMANGFQNVEIPERGHSVLL
ncbi:MAG: MBL fold metallo-hydrolase [Rhodothermia bacterium]|nr:MBL fold metallo-hydrolase [Rhodothermia bacterium]